MSFYNDTLKQINTKFIILHWHKLNHRLGPVAEWVGLPNNLYKLIANRVLGRARLCKLQKGVHSILSLKW